jgi:molybdate transport system ATP-binding protein
MSEPELLILDEPFDGLDVQSRAQLASCWVA